MVGPPTQPRAIATVLDALRARLAELPPTAPRRHFLETYARTTAAVGAALTAGGFEDPRWVERLDVVFAGLYLAALDAADTGAARGGRGSRAAVARPWRLAFDAPSGLHPLQHVLLGVNAHINYDLPQALLAVLSDDDFADPVLLERRRRDHERIDAVLSRRVAAEDRELARRHPRTLVDRAMTPLNRRGSERFLREARRKVWHNTQQLQRARLAGSDAYSVRLAELELLSAARIADLLEPGPVLLRLAVGGFGVVLPPPA